MTAEDLKSLLRRLVQVNWRWHFPEWSQIEGLLNLVELGRVNHGVYGRIDYAPTFDSRVWAQLYNDHPVCLDFEIDFWSADSIIPDGAINVAYDRALNTTRIVLGSEIYDGPGDADDAPAGQSASQVAAWTIPNGRLMIQYLEGGSDTANTIVLAVCPPDD